VTRREPSMLADTVTLLTNHARSVRAWFARLKAEWACDMSFTQMVYQWLFSSSSKPNSPRSPIVAAVPLDIESEEDAGTAYPLWLQDRTPLVHVVLIVIFCLRQALRNSGGDNFPPVSRSAF
jgi:hypothetical protein